MVDQSTATEAYSDLEADHLGLYSSVDSESTRASRKTKIGNRIDCAEFYGRAKQAVFDLKIYQFLQHQETGDGNITITICNLWRLEKLQGAYHFYSYDLEKRVWHKNTSADIQGFPIVPFYPYTTSTLFAYRILRKAIYKTVLSAGYHQLCPGFDDMATGDTTGTKVIPRKKILDIAVEYFLGYSGFDDEQATKSKKKHFIKFELIAYQAMKYRKLFYQYFYDAELTKLVLAIDYKYFNYEFYLKALMHRDDVIRTAKERKNCIPILFHINTTHWHKQNLFSRKLWVRGDKKYKLVDKLCFTKDRRDIRFESFESKSGWTWIVNQPISVVNAWANNHRSSVLATILSRINNPNIKAPAIAYRHIMYQWRRHYGYADHNKLLWLYNAYLIQITHIWQNQGFAEVRQWLKKDNSFAQIIDWLLAEGFNQGFPDKKSTWQSLSNRSDDWHAVIAKANKFKQYISYQLSWNCILSDTLIDGICFKPILSVQGLIDEGLTMDHCIGGDGYIHMCLDNVYRAFHVCDEAGNTATLGIYTDNNRKWILDQLCGPSNEIPHKALIASAKKLVTHYNRALKTQR